MTVLSVGRDAQAVIPAGVDNDVLLWNLDLVNPVYIGTGRSLSFSDDSIPPLGTLTVDGATVRYASTLAAAEIPLQVTIGGKAATPSPAQAADQISLLGLMKDTTGQNIRTGINATNGQLATGVAPFANNLQSYSALQQGQGASPVILHTFGTAGRIWAGTLSFALSANAAHVGNDQAYALLKYSPPVGADQVLAVVEVAVGGASNTDSGDAPFSLPGLPVDNTGQLIMVVNGGAAIVNAIMRASACALVSFP